MLPLLVLLVLLVVAVWGGGEMERFLVLLRLLSHKRRGRRYRADEDYQEGYEDVYYYNTHLLSESHRLRMERERVCFSHCRHIFRDVTAHILRYCGHVLGMLLWRHFRDVTVDVL